MSSWPAKLLCSRPLTIDLQYMGSTSVPSNSLQLELSRGSQTLASGDDYIAGEVLTYSLIPGSYQYVVDVTAGDATILSGTCSGKRRNNKPSGSITMPASGIVLLQVGYASSHGPIQISQFELKAGTIAPTLTVTAMPSNPTYSPTVEPSVRPGDPTHSPTAAPTTIPTSASPTIPQYPDNKTENIVAGVVIGVVGTMILAGLFHWYIAAYQNDSLPDFSKYPIAGTLACIFGLVSLVLVLVWNYGTSDFGKHYTYMTGGFFFGQVVAVSVWGFFSAENRIYAKIAHIICQSIAAACMIVALYHIIDAKDDAEVPHLTSMHSWLGVVAVSVYGLTYIWGTVMNVLNICLPDSIIHKAIPMGAIHRMLGLIAFGVTMVAVETGIMNATGNGACNYSTYDGQQGIDSNPADNYPDIPYKCRIVNGLGITVLIATIFVYVAVANHHTNWLRPNQADSARHQVVTHNGVIAGDNDIQMGHQ